MSIEETPCIQGFVRMCNDGWNQGWHERNGGNLTYRMTDEDVEIVKPYFTDDPGSWVEMGVCAKDLAGQYFITTGSGKYMRNAISNVSDTIGVVEINDEGNAYRIVWGLDNGGRPTSEFPTHFLNHSVRAKATDNANRVIYHAHTPAIIAMTNILPLDARTFSRELWKTMTECIVVFPMGVGVVPWMVPGGSEIAVATSELMKTYDAVIWSQHGLFCSGPDFDTTFGLMHTIEKSAQIWCQTRSINGNKPFVNTITDEGLRQIGKDFNIEIIEEFLD